MSRYILTEKIKKILEARGYGDTFICVECGIQNKDGVEICFKCGGKVEERHIGLVCKICDCQLISGLSKEQAVKKNRLEDMGEEIESKQQRRGKSKLYHASCYDKSHFEPKDEEEISDEELEKFFSLPRKHKKMSHKVKKNQRKRKRRKEKKRRLEGTK